MVRSNKKQKNKKGGGSMFKYGLYLQDNNNIFKDIINPVEGFLYIEGTKIIGIWAEIKYKSDILIEALPYEKDGFDLNYADNLLREALKRLDHRIKIIDYINGNKNKREDIKWKESVQ